MAGAIIVNATVLHNTRYDAFSLTALLFFVFVILACGRRQQIKGVGGSHSAGNARPHHVQGRLETTHRTLTNALTV